MRDCNNLPLPIIIAPIILACISLIAIYSNINGSLNSFLYKQSTYILIFFPLSLAIGYIDTKYIYKYSYIIFIISVILLISVKLIGHNAMGAKRWLNLGVIKIQPSEMIKVSIILFFARYYSDSQRYHDDKRNLLIPISISIFIIFLVLIQPDLGTAIILLLLIMSILFFLCIAFKYFMYSAIAFIMASPLIWKHMKTYQKSRIINFLKPDSDPLGKGYNILQSKIAIGSGGIWGKGYMLGTQTKLNFLPENKTDFIFASIAEEFGFLGGAAIIILYASLVITCYAISYSSKARFNKIIAFGVGSLLFLHSFINIGMVMGIMPVVGIPLPFVSYGGSITATIFIAIGLVINCYRSRNQRKINF